MNLHLKKQQGLRLLDLIYDKMTSLEDIIDAKDDFTPTQRVYAKNEWLVLFEIVVAIRQQNPTLEPTIYEESESKEKIEVPF